MKQRLTAALLAVALALSLPPPALASPETEAAVDETVPPDVEPVGEEVPSMISEGKDVSLYTRDENDVAYAVIGGDIYFDESTGTITGCDSRVIIADIPSSINNVPVTNIESSAFTWCNNLETVSIPDGVTSIPYDAFAVCRNLKNVSIPRSVTTIGRGAFYDCVDLKSISIPNSVTSIGDYAFSGSGLRRISIPHGVTTICEKTFDHCANLTSVFIPNSVTTIQDSAFEYCERLKSISIPDSVTAIGKKVLSCCFALESVSISNSVAEIMPYMFQSCFSLKSVTIPSGVTRIENLAFRNCVNLSWVSIPDSVTTIESRAFAYCNKLTDIYYAGTKEQWNSIQKNKDDFANCTIHYNSTGPNPISVMKKPLRDLTLVVYENKKSAAWRTDSYELSRDAQVSFNSTPLQTEGNGACKLPDAADTDSVTITKEGFAPITRTGAQIREFRKIYLEPVKEGLPTVTAVWLDGVDVRHFEKAVGPLDTNEATITADVVWDSSKGEGTIKLVQGAKSVTLQGNSITTVLKDNFDVSKTIYIWAGYDSDHATYKPLKIKIDTPESLDGIKLDFSNKLKFSMPDDFPFLGGMDISVGLYSKIPVTVSVEDGKVYAAIGFQKDSTKKDGKWETKTFTESAKKLWKTLSIKGAAEEAGKQWSKMKDHVAKGEGAFGVDAGYSIAGFAEGYLTDEGVVWLDSGIVFGISGKVEYSFPFFLVTIPMFFEVGFSPEAQVQLNLLVNEAAKSFTPNGVIEGKIEVSGGVGCGVKKVLSIKGGLKTNMKPLWEINLHQTDHFKLTTGLDAYAEAEFLFFKTGDSWPLGESVRIEYPDPADLNGLSGFELNAPANYTLKPEQEMTDASTFTANNNVTLMETAGSRAGTFADNVYSQSRPQLAAFSDGTLLAVWTGLDNTRATYDRPRLYYSLCESGTWSAPQPVTSGTTLEAYPSLSIAGDTAYLAWNSANADMGDAPDIASIGPTLEVSVGVFDRSANSWSAQTLTHNQSLDLLPVMYAHEGGAAVAWQGNTANDILGLSGTSSISYATLAGGQWTCREGAYTDLDSLTDLDVAMTNGAVSIAWTQEEADGTLTVYRDGAKQGAGSGAALYDGSLYWYSGGRLYRDGQDTGAALSSDRFQLRNNTLLYITGDGLYSTLTARYYDASTATWSGEVALTDGATCLTDFTAVYVGDALQALMSSTEVTGALENLRDGEDPYGATHLRLLDSEPYCDLSIDEPWYAEDTFTTGSTMAFHVPVTNNGTLPASFQVTAACGGTVYSAFSTAKLLPGCTKEIEVGCTQGESLDSALTFTVSPVGVMDADTSNDSVTLTLSYEDVTVEQIDSGVTEDGRCLVYANIVNRGYSPQFDITVNLYQDSAEGTPLQTKTVAALSSLQAEAVQFEVPAPASRTSYTISITHAGTDMNTANNSDFTVLEDVQSGPVIQLDGVEGQSARLYLENVPAGQLILAAYQGSRMMGTGFADLTGSESSIAVEMNTDPAGRTLKAFVVEPGTYEPLMPARELN